MAALLLGIGPGDEVITPSFTFVSTINAFVLRGAHPIFLDIRRDTLNLDECQLEARMTDRTRAILVVHYAGVGSEMDQILAVSRRWNVPVVEDNAHGLFGKYKDRWLGTLGCLATQSFHETKNFTSGEGGALLINEDRFIERAEIVREKGTDRGRFFRGQVDKYTWVDIGSSYLPSDILAAYLWAQLEMRDRVQEARRNIWTRYSSALQDWAKANGVQLPWVPKHCEQAYHMFYVILPTMQARQELIQYLKHRGIHAVFHYQPLHLSAMGQRFGGKGGDCPVTEEISDCLLRLPFYTDLSEPEQERVIDAILGFRS
jgi:dTDP-4-amino-4,6-dideoxygalactose transaminase